MRYLCLVSAATLLEELPEVDAARHLGEYSELVEELRRSGHLVACERLEPSAAAATVRVRHGRLAVIDGPFAETEEQIGGYLVIEARDLNEAIQVATRIPGAHRGSVEVRPIAEDARTLRALGRAPR